MAKIIFDRVACIGAFACVAADPEHWTYADDGKVDLKGGVEDPNKPGIWTLEVSDEKEIAALKAAAESCPVYAIKVEE